MASNEVKQSWKEVNKVRKEKRKKWIEEKLLKKAKKAAVEEVKAEIAKTTSEIIIPSTVSIAIPGSILENAQSPELRTYLAGQIARAACIFQVDEVIVFDDYGDSVNCKKATVEENDGIRITRQCCAQLGRLLQYLECPQYLRKYFFPLHKDLQYAGVLNPLDAPHHLRQNNTFMFREGVVTNKPVKEGKGSQVNVGLLEDVTVDKLLIPGIRCTVKLLPRKEREKKIKGIIVSPNTPRAETGVYWGYTVRLANSLSQVFSQCPYKDGYDLSIGTSDKGTSVDDFECPEYNHVLIVFGGLQGLESALENDDVLTVEDPSLLFDQYLNTLPCQGSRTIRTEEAVLITLAALRTKFKPLVTPSVFTSNNTNESNATSNENSKDFSRFD